MYPIHVVATGDDHFNERCRLDECVRIHDWIVDYLDDMQPDLYTCNGDVYERASTPIERLEAVRHYRRAADIAPTLIIRGNHDRWRDLAILASIRAKFPIYVIEEADVIPITTARGAKLVVAGVAWPTRLGNLDAEAIEAQRRVFEGLGHMMDQHPGAARLLAGHFDCRGAVTSAGQPLAGGGLTVSLGDLALARPDAVVMSHIHKPQEWDDIGVPAIYCGSNYRTKHGESEEKSIVDLTYENGRFHFCRVITPARAMHEVKATWQDGALLVHNAPPEDEVPQSDVRLVYQVVPEHLEAARLAADAWVTQWLDGGAAMAKADYDLQVSTRARMQEVSLAKTLAAKIEAHWTATANRPPEAMAERLLGERLSELESDAA